MHIERRRKRSSFAGLALHYWLRSIADARRLFAIVLADSAGLVVASSMRGPEADELAALAPLVARGRDSAVILPQKTGLPIIVQKVEVDSSALYLCAVGEQDRSNDGLRMAVSGVHRILMTH